MSNPLERFPAELVALPRWVVWRLEDRGGKPTKVPYAPRTRTHASSTDPATWATAADALAAWQAGEFDGLGFVFAEADGITGIDLDGCRDPDTGEIAAWARTAIDTLDSYTEISPSGRGVHIFVRGNLPPGRRRKGRIEMYDSGRFFTVTGEHLDGTPATVEERADRLASFHRSVFEQDADAPESDTGALDSDPLAFVASEPTNAKIAKLWAGDWQGAGYVSHSEADLALCTMLAQRLGGDAALVDAFFRRSGLMREKWDRSWPDSTYGAETIKKAVEGARAHMAGAGTPYHEAITRLAVDDAGDSPRGERAHRWQPHTVGELFDMEFPPLEWLLDGWIAAEKYHLLTGESGLGKSMFILAWLLAAAAGRRFLGIETRPVRAIVVDEENGQRETNRRLRALCAGLGIDPHGLPIYVLNSEGIRLGNAQDVLDLTAFIRDVGANLVMTDSLSRVFDGNENAAQDVTAFHHVISRTRKATGCAWLMIHHLNKGGSERSAGDRIRGSSDLKAYADIHIQLRREGREGDPDKVIRVQQEKQRVGREAEPLFYRLADGIGDGAIILSRVSDAALADRRAPFGLPERALQLARLLWDRFGAGGATYAEWRRAAAEAGIAAAESTFSSNLRRMADAGAARQSGGRWYADPALDALSFIVEPEG